MILKKAINWIFLEIREFMVDSVSKEKRSWIMSRVRSKNTKPELYVRSLIHRLGYRFRVAVSSLPGCPDIVLKKYKTIIFVNGCFWHGHNCRKSTLPKTNSPFWEEKIERNKNRDLINHEKLKGLGWNVFVIWECELNQEDLSDKIQQRIGTTV